MIFATLVGLVAMMQSAPPAPPPGYDIIVIGERLKNLRLVTKRDRKTGMTRCITKPSSGDPVLDAGVCATYLACLPKVASAPALEACMRPPLTDLVRSWSERKIARVQQG